VATAILPLADTRVVGPPNGSVTEATPLNLATRANADCTAASDFGSVTAPDPDVTTIDALGWVWLGKR